MSSNLLERYRRLPGPAVGCFSFVMAFGVSTCIAYLAAMAAAHSLDIDSWSRSTALISGVWSVLTCLGGMSLFTLMVGIHHGITRRVIAAGVIGSLILPVYLTVVFRQDIPAELTLTALVWGAVAVAIAFELLLSRRIARRLSLPVKEKYKVAGAMR